ncbi:MAG: hypothetical protein M0Z67_05270 [Nitrospiraceae bacterium]|nr:hypothetical protein [Nitrospiraceae bacterium]
MLEEENLTLKNKIVELKERLSQIYSHAAIDANKSKAFESEFSLYLKACEHPRKERMYGIKLQHDATKFGMVVLAVVLAFAAYVLNVQILPGILVLLGFGFVACGLMYLLLEGEIRSKRAGDYCAQLETYFMQHRWTSEQNEAANLPKIPLWEEQRERWEEDLFAGGRYGKRAVYAPLRVALTLADLLALFCILYFFVAHSSGISWVVMIAGCLAWASVVAVQMLLVHAIIDKVGRRLQKGHESPGGYQGTVSGRRPGTWVNLLKLFFVMDIIFPVEIRKGPE